MSNKKPLSRAGSGMKSQLKEGIGIRVGVIVIITAWTLGWYGNWGVWSSPTRPTLSFPSVLLMLKCQENRIWTLFYDCIFRAWSRFNPHLIAFSVVQFQFFLFLSFLSWLFKCGCGSSTTQDWSKKTEQVSVAVPLLGMGDLWQGNHMKGLQERALFTTRLSGSHYPLNSVQLTLWFIRIMDVA